MSTRITREEKAIFNDWCRQATEDDLRHAITVQRAAGHQDYVVIAKQELVARGLSTSTPDTGESK